MNKFEANFQLFHFLDFVFFACYACLAMLGIELVVCESKVSALPLNQEPQFTFPILEHFTFQENYVRIYTYSSSMKHNYFSLGCSLHSI